MSPFDIASTTVSRMLSDRCLSVCLSVCNVGILWSNGCPSQQLLSSCRDIVIDVKNFFYVFTARRNARIPSAVLATAIPSVCLSGCLSVRPSYAGIVSK